MKGVIARKAAVKRCCAKGEGRSTWVVVGAAVVVELAFVFGFERAVVVQKGRGERGDFSIFFFVVVGV